MQGAREMCSKGWKFSETIDRRARFRSIAHCTTDILVTKESVECEIHTSDENELVLAVPFPVSGSRHGNSLNALLSRFSVPELEGKHRRITAVDFRPDGQEILASYSSDYIYLFSPMVRRRFRTKDVVLCALSF